MQQIIGFVFWTPKQLYDRLNYVAGKYSLNNISISKLTGRNSANLSDLRSTVISETTPQIPERTIVTNYKSEHFPSGHYSVLEYCITAISSATTSVTKVTVSILRAFYCYVFISSYIVNVPSNKTKSIADDWTKLWKQVGGIFMGDFSSKLYFQLPIYAVWELLLTGEKLAASTKTKCNILQRIPCNFYLGRYAAEGWLHIFPSG